MLRHHATRSQYTHSYHDTRKTIVRVAAYAIIVLRLATTIRLAPYAITIRVCLELTNTLVLMLANVTSYAISVPRLATAIRVG
eukprot:2092406-Rhodomonas_salina.2